MGEAKLQVAREMIQEKRYLEARLLLQGIDHPDARALLAELDSEEKSTRFTPFEAPHRPPIIPRQKPKSGNE